MSISERARSVAAAIRAGAPVVADVETPAREVIALMRAAGSGCALITRADKLAGVFTERDVLFKVLGSRAALDAPVRAHMTVNPRVLTDGASILEAVGYMDSGGFRNVPLVDGAGKPVGCIRHKDIIAYLVEHFADRALNVPSDPDRVPGSRDGA
jgi:CBS domain-containing protein